MDLIDNNGEDCDYLVCPPATPLHLPDNLVGHCTACHQLIQFRPHAPKRPVRICIGCAKQRLGEKPGDAVITVETVKDVIRQILKARSN